MKKRSSISMVVVILAGLVMLLPMPAAASQPQDVTFEFYGNLFTQESSFSATGVVNDSGIYEETRLNFADGTAHGTVTTTSEAGTITFKWQALITSETATHRTLEGRWTIVSGSGAYANLHGEGTVDIFVDFTTAELFVTEEGVAHYDNR
jgi:hypothetical protein